MAETTFINLFTPNLLSAFIDLLDPLNLLFKLQSYECPLLDSGIIVLKDTIPAVQHKQDEVQVIPHTYVSSSREWSLMTWLGWIWLGFDAHKYRGPSGPQCFKKIQISRF